MADKGLELAGVAVLTSVKGEKGRWFCAGDKARNKSRTRKTN